MRFYLRAIGYFRQDLPLIVASLILIGLSTLASLVQPFLFFKIPFDTIFAHTPANDRVSRLFLWVMRHIGVGSGDLRGQVLALAVTAVVLRVAQELLAMGQRLLAARIGYNGLMRVRCDLFRKLQELSLAYHKSQPQGDAIYRLSYDAGGFQTILSVLINSMLVSAVTLIFMSWIMLSMNWRLGLITLAVAPLLLWTTRAFAGPLKRRWIEAKETDTELTTAIQRSVASIGLVQAYGREADEFERFQRTHRSSIQANLRQAKQDALYWLMVGTIFGVGSAIVFAYGGLLVLRGTLLFGDLTIFLVFVNQVYSPLQALSGSGASIQSGVAGAQRVFEVLDRDPIIKDAPGAISLQRQPRKLSLRNVEFEYRPGEPVLRNLTAEIATGRMVAFVGSSGVGKTTLLSLLPRFYDPTHGALLLDDLDVRTIRLRDLRSHVALVLQDSLLLPTTVAENIAYGRPTATEAQIRHAAELAGAAAFIEKLNEGYHTVVSESGANLSGGQRQRISIARAILTEAPILVFDEPTSALDPQNEALIAKTLRNLAGQRTVIIVSHRLSTVVDCDEIFVMDEGSVVEQGTHRQLLDRHGLYFSMAQHQLQLPADFDPAQSREA